MIGNVHRVEFDFVDGDFPMLEFLAKLMRMGGYGSSRSVRILDGGEEFEFHHTFDGDGADRIHNLKWDGKDVDVKEVLDSEGSASAVLATIRAEIAADGWWEKMSNRERRAYVRAHPKSKYARLAGSVSAGQRALADHLKSTGWERKNASWHHPKSRRYISLKKSGTHQHHMVITHANGDVTNKATNSLRVAKRVADRMTKSASGGISRTLRERKGSLHAHLGVPHGKTIPIGKLEKLAKSDHPLSGRARLVLNLKRAKKRPPLEWLPASRSVASKETI